MLHSLEHNLYKDIDREKKFIHTHTYNKNELNERDLRNLQDAQEKGFVHIAQFCGKIKVDFFDIKHTNIIPKILFHVRSVHTSKDMDDGIAKPFYVQTKDLEVEPENVSLFDKSEVNIFMMKMDAQDDYSIILDQESFHGIPGEYLKSFIVYPKDVIILEKTDRGIDEIRAS